MMDWQDHDAHGHRRRYSRRPVQLPAKLRIGGVEIPAVTENISPGGAFFNVALPESATELVAAIGLPHGRDLLVRARVRWRRTEPPGVGIEFETFLQGLQEGELKSLLG